MRLSTFSSGALRHDDTSPATSMFAGLVAALRGFGMSLRADIEQRRLRHDLAELDPVLLRDIGVAEDEIPRIRTSDTFTPRAWQS